MSDRPTDGFFNQNNNNKFDERCVVAYTPYGFQCESECSSSRNDSSQGNLSQPALVFTPPLPPLSPLRIPSHSCVVQVLVSSSMYRQLWARCARLLHHLQGDGLSRAAVRMMETLEWVDFLYSHFQWVQAGLPSGKNWLEIKRGTNSAVFRWTSFYKNEHS